MLDGSAEGGLPLRTRAVWRDRLAAATLVAFVLPGCASRQFDALMLGWHGHPASDLVGTWGPPTYTYSDGHGGRVLVYLPVAAAETAPRPRPRPRDPDEVEQAPNLFEFQAAMTTAWPVYRAFFVDGLGRIARSQWRGTWVCCSR